MLVFILKILREKKIYCDAELSFGIDKFKNPQGIQIIHPMMNIYLI